MNSTLTWVTPPREPVCYQNMSLDSLLQPLLVADAVNIPVRPKTRVTFTSLTGTFEDSILAIYSNQFSFVSCLLSYDTDLNIARGMADLVFLKVCRTFSTLVISIILRVGC